MGTCSRLLEGGLVVSLSRCEEVHGHTVAVHAVAHDPTGSVVLELVAAMKLGACELLVLPCDRTPVGQAKLDQAAGLHPATVAVPAIACVSTRISSRHVRLRRPSARRNPDRCLDRDVRLLPCGAERHPASL